MAFALSILVMSLAMVLVGNALVAFFVAFYWQARVISGVFNGGDSRANFISFMAGDFRPDLRPKWLKAIKYVAISYVALFAFAGGLELLAPELLR